MALGMQNMSPFLVEWDQLGFIGLDCSQTAVLTRSPNWSTDKSFPESKVHGANVGHTWGRKDPGGPHVGNINFAIWFDKIPNIMKIPV